MITDKQRELYEKMAQEYDDWYEWAMNTYYFYNLNEDRTIIEKFIFYKNILELIATEPLSDERVERLMNVNEPLNIIWASFAENDNNCKAFYKSFYRECLYNITE